MKWTDEQQNLLTEYYHDFNLSFEDIAEKLERSYSALCKKASNLGLKGRRGRFQKSLSYVCPICGEICTSPQAIGGHMQKHSDKENTGQFKKGQTPWNKGKLQEEWLSQYALERIKAVRIKKGQHNSPRTEFKKGLIPWNKGKTKKDDPRLDYPRPTAFKKGQTSWNKGKQLPQLQGPNHPNWKGGYHNYYGFNWHIQKHRALARDNYTCQLCGATVERLGQKPDVHHIKPFSSFSDYREANKLDNLITLCRSCHQKIEWRDNF